MSNAPSTTPTAAAASPRAAGTAVPTTAPLDRETFAWVTQRGAEIANLLGVRNPAANQLGAQLLGQLQTFADQTWPDQANKRKSALVTFQARRTTVYHALWTQIHSRPLGTIWKPGANDDAFWDDIAKQLPGCNGCRSNLAAYRTSTPPDYSSADAYFAWGVNLHNSINLANGKPAMDVATARALYAPQAAATAASTTTAAPGSPRTT